jgi:putative sigma-54 modulation protein
MNIEFVGRSYEIDDRVRSYAEKKLGKVTKFLEEPIDARFTLEVVKHREIADLYLSHRHGVMQATEETSQMLDAINLAVDKVEKQARRSRKKLVLNKRRAGRNGQNWPVEVLEAASVEAGTPRIIKSSKIRIKPMSIEEAALQLESSKNEFVVFRDSASDRVAVLYRRKDNNYGLIAPEF